MEGVGPASYAWALFAVMVVSVSALAGVLRLRLIADVAAPAIHLYQLYFLTGAIGWLLLGLMSAGWLPMHPGVSGASFIVSTSVLLPAVVGPLRPRRPAWALAAVHLVLVASLFLLAQDRQRWIVIAIYGAAAYALIAGYSFRRARQARNVGHTLIGLAAAQVVLAAVIQLAAATHGPFPFAHAAGLAATASGFVLVGIGLLSSVVVEQLRRLRGLALRDPLTGLHNRRGLDQAMLASLPAHGSPGQPVCAIAMDIDHFKRVNDTHGHEGGDVVLKAFASLAARHARQGDICARLGGEEFVLLLANADAGQGRLVAERIRAAVERMQVTYAEAAIPLTCSFGVAAARQGEDLDALLKDADKALYAAKADGRNTVRVAGH